MRLHLAALLYFLSRMAVVGFVFAVPALYFVRGQVEVPLVVGGAVFVAALFTGYYIAAAGLRCAACSGPVLLDNGNRKHPHAHRFPGLNHRARVAWDILFGASYQCMYCNTRCRCKKNWGSSASPRKGNQGRSFQPASRPAAASGETFPQGIFGDLTPLSEAEEESFHRYANGSDADAGVPVPERTVQPSFSPAAVFPDVRTVPLAVSPPAPSTGSIPAAAATRETPQMDVIEAEPLPATPPPPLPINLPKSPVPWAAPFPSESIETASAMNRPTPETQSVQGSNPFLAAAAAMPQPPGPMLPPIPPAPNRAPTEFRSAPEVPPFMTPEFPQPAAPAPAGESPTPWTLPSMPPPAATGFVPGAIQPPVLPAAPVTAPLPAVHTAPVPAPAPASPPPTTPVHQPAAALPPDLLKDVVSVLEDGRRALTDAFQGLIDRLEARLSTAHAAPPAAVPAPQQPVMIQAPPPPAPPVAMPPAAPVEYAMQHPAHAALPPREKTAPLPLPPLPPAAPAMHIPQPQPEPEPIPAAPRRKFARPSGIAAQQLNTALQDVFEAPAPPAPLPPAAPAAPYSPAVPSYANGNGHPYAAPAQPVYNAQPAPQAYPGIPATPPTSPFEMITPGQFPAPAAPVRQQSMPPAPASPFAVSPTPLMSPADPNAAPAPFTFLKNEGDHFAPMTPPPAPSGYDPLDDTPLPWMQPVGGRN